MNRPSASVFAAGLIAIVLAVEAPSACAASADHLLDAMRAEMERGMASLRLPGNPAPYFIACSLWQVRGVAAASRFGSLEKSEEQRTAQLQVELRVGDYALDNSNFTPKQMWGGWSRLDMPLAVPIDGDPDLVRRCIWWALDRTYKQAVEDFKRKKAVLKNRSSPPVADDYAKAPSLIFQSARTPQVLPDLQAVIAHSRELSGKMRDYASLRTAGVRIEALVSDRRYINSEGVCSREIENMACLDVFAAAQADDGVWVGDSLTLMAENYGALPPLQVQQAAVIGLVARVAAMRAAPLMEDFSGPVLFEAEAAAELCARVVGPAMASRRQSIVEDEVAAAWEMESRDESLRRKIGRRVMAAGFSVVDDPSLRVLDGVPLLGGADIDLEGVKPQRVELVKDGILKTLLTTRTPDKRLNASNGHAFLKPNHPYGGQPAQADISNLLISYQGGVSDEELLRRLVQAIKEQDAECGLLIRRFPHPAVLREIRREGDIQSWRGRSEKPAIREPLMAFRVDRKGRSEPVRLVAMAGFELSMFKDVLAAGRTRAVLNRRCEGGVRTVVAPALLFEEGVVLKPEENIQKPPLLPAPATPRESLGWVTL